MALTIFPVNFLCCEHSFYLKTPLTNYLLGVFMYASKMHLKVGQVKKIMCSAGFALFLQYHPLAQILKPPFTFLFAFHPSRVNNEAVLSTQSPGYI